MNKTEARRRVYAGLAASLEADIGVDAECWLYTDATGARLNDADARQMQEAARNVVTELEQRAGLKPVMR